MTEITSAMKAECMGEFSLEIKQSCSACHFHGAQEDCEVCGGEIEWTEKRLIPWTTMKEIYVMMDNAAKKRLENEDSFKDAVIDQLVISHIYSNEQRIHRLPH